VTSRAFLNIFGSFGAQVRARVAVCGLVLTVLASAACDRDDRVRAEAHTFLALYRATDHRAPIAERERKIAQLEQLTLSEQAVRTARDQCVGAHRALIRAERENEVAAGQLDRALAAQPDGGPLQVTDTARIRAEIDRAEGSLTDARGRFEKCEAQARTLSLRFGG
jgi:DNA polymerase III delta prime subunit